MKNRLLTKAVFGKLLDKNLLEDPLYLTNQDEESIKKRLDYLLLWYDVDVLDSQKLFVFNGVLSFVYVLVGSIEAKLLFNEARNIKIKVIRFKHPVNNRQKYDYSYGILIDSSGVNMPSSTPGWLIFFDTATDYSGYGGKLFKGAEFFIREYSEFIDLKEIIVEKEVFKKFLAEKSVSSAFNQIIRMTLLEKQRLDLAEITTKLNDFIRSDVKGKFFEFLVFYYLFRSRAYKNLKWDVHIGNKQIDILAETENHVCIYECRVQIHKDDNVIESILEKLKVVKRRIKQTS